MPSLREVQQQFLRGVLYAETGACEWIEGDGISPPQRLSIYANNARETFVGTLEAAFPVVRALGGEDWFRQTVVSYWRVHPSRAGNLHFVGEQFAAFLGEQLASTPYAYFTDVAALEWAYQEAMVAAEHPSFDVAALSSVDAERYGDLQFEVHPAVRLVSSPYPILDLWRAHQPESADVEHVDLTSGAQHVVLTRLADHVEFRAIDAASWQLLHALSQRVPLRTAADRALSFDSQFDLASALARFIAHGVLVDFSLSPDQEFPCV